MQCFIDPTNPETREFVWQKAMENYRTLGVDLFWLDEAEPEYTVQDFDIYRYYDGPANECANEYPARYSQTFFDGMKKEGIENPLNLEPAHQKLLEGWIVYISSMEAADICCPPINSGKTHV